MTELAFENITGDRFLTFIFVLLALIIPGAGYLYITDYDMFLNLDIVRLIILSIFFSLPLFIFGIVSCIAKVIHEKDRHIRFMCGMWYSSAFALIVFYGSVLLHLIYNKPLFIMYFLSVFLSVVLTIKHVIKHFWKKRKTNKKSKVSKTH